LTRLPQRTEFKLSPFYEANLDFAGKQPGDILKTEPVHLAGDLTADPTMAKAIEMNVSGKRKSAAPILVVHGTIDNVVAPEDTKALLPRACNTGGAIKVSWFPDKDHRSWPWLSSSV
jgi:hypothetical protein